MDEALKHSIGTALGMIPSGVFVLTAQHEDRRAGQIVTWVQQVCFEPPMVSVAVAKGRPIMPLISESRFFGLCQVGETDRVILRKFSQDAPVNEDPFLGFEMLANRSTRVPILTHAMSFVECELACHMDVEGDHDLFVGTVRQGVCNGGAPKIHLREDGYKY